MELLLNLLWLLLIPPAFYWWFQQRLKSRSTLRFVALVGALAFLFPVISATDDLHSIAELCENSPSKRVLKYFTGEARTTPQGSVGSAPAALVSAFNLQFSPEVLTYLVPMDGERQQRSTLGVLLGRAPPTSSLS